MTPWELLDTAKVVGEKNKLSLYRRGDEFSIKAGHSVLMNSRVHGSEDALAELACQRLNDRPRARVLLGGLGMGFTLAAALSELGPDAEVIVAEFVPAVVKWNREWFSNIAGHPLEDSRVKVYEGDVAQLIRAEPDIYDAILLDVDNGPEGLTRKENDALYSPTGLSAAVASLKPRGIFGVWSISPDQGFSNKLRHAGFTVDEIRARAHGRRRGARHMIWLGTIS